MMTRYDPFRDTVPLFASMDRLLQDSFVRPLGWMGGNGIPVDVEETGDGYVVTASLPGWNPEDVNISVQNGTLTISGEQKAQTEPEQGKIWHLRERTMSSFRRTITLPVPVEADQAQASYENGVLTLTLPKAESAKPKVIKLGGPSQQQIAAPAKAK